MPTGLAHPAVAFASRVALTLLTLSMAAACSTPQEPEPPTGGLRGFGVPSARGVGFFKDELGSTYKLVQLSLAMSGESLISCDDDERLLDASMPTLVYDGPIRSGAHQLVANAKLKGHGYGIFSYLKGYRFKMASSHRVEVEPETTVAITAIAYERGGITTPIEDRPQFRFVIRDGADLPASTPQGCPWAPSQ